MIHRYFLLIVFLEWMWVYARSTYIGDHGALVSVLMTHLNAALALMMILIPALLIQWHTHRSHSNIHRWWSQKVFLGLLQHKLPIGCFLVIKNYVFIGTILTAKAGSNILKLSLILLSNPSLSLRSISRAARMYVYLKAYLKKSSYVH